MRVFIIGFMCCGKTYNGLKISEILNMNFVDMDKKIENNTGKTIVEIFNSEGEEFFRQIETKVLKETLLLNNTIISTGGGIIELKENRELLKKEKVIFLDEDFEIIRSRLKEDRERPKNIDVDKVALLYKKRLSYYMETADYIVKSPIELGFLVDLVKKIKKNS